MGVCNSLKKKDQNFIIVINKHLQKNNNSLLKEKAKKIIAQMDKNVCKIKKKESTGNGFLCIIPFPPKLKRLPA